MKRSLLILGSMLVLSGCGEEEVVTQEVTPIEVQAETPVAAVITNELSNSYKESLQWFVRENYVTVDALTRTVEVVVSNPQWYQNKDTINQVLQSSQNVEALMDVELYRNDTSEDQRVGEVVDSYIYTITVANSSLQDALLAGDTEGVSSALAVFSDARELLVEISGEVNGGV